MKRRQPTRMRLARTLLPAALLCAGCLGPALALPAEPPPAPILYRKIYVPEDRIADWPRGGFRFAPPLDRRAFEQLIEAVCDRAAAHVEEIVIEQAEYAARLEGDQLVDGRAVLGLRRLSDEATALSLGDSNLAIDLRGGNGNGGEIGSGGAAARLVIGAVPEGAAAVLVPAESDRVEFAFSHRGRRAADGTILFHLRLPPAPTGVLTLDVPPGLLVEADGGAVFGPDAPPAAAAEESGAAAAAPRTTWRVLLGGQPDVILRILPQRADAADAAGAVIRQVNTYRLAREGMELTCQWTLDADALRRRQLVVKLDAPLELLEVRAGAARLTWTLRSDEEGTVAAIDLADLPARESTALTLRALGPLPLDTPFALPTILPPQLAWRQGRILLHIAPPLEVARLETKGCHPASSAAAAGADPQGLEMAFDGFEPAASVTLHLVLARGRIEVRSGAAVQLGAAEARGVVRAAIRGHGPLTFDVSAVTPAAWIIDSVESEPAGAVSDWSVDATGRRIQRLDIRLNRPLPADEDLMLVIRAHRRPVGVGVRSPLEELRPVHFPHAEKRRGLLSLSVEPGLQATLAIDGGVPPLDAQALSAADRQLLGETAGRVLFDAIAAADAAVTLRRERPQYTGAIDVDCRIEGEMLIERYAVRCQPQSAAVDRVLVHFSDAQGAVTQWSVVGEGPEGCTARRLSAEEQMAAGVGAAGQTWQVQLRRPRTVPFELTAERRRDFTAPLPVGLVCLPEAAGQSGQVSVTSRRLDGFALENRALTPALGAAAVPADTAVAAVFRYDPLQHALGRPRAALVAAPAPEEERPAAWVWRQRLQSRITGEATTEHLASFFLENLGRDEAAIDVPAAAEFRGALVGGIDAPLRIDPEHPQRATVRLPAGQRYVALSVAFETHDRRLGLFRSVRPPAVEIDLPVLDRSWEVWLSPSLAAALDPAAESAAASRPGLPQRLFGRLARSPEQRPVSLFDPAFWQSLWGGPAPLEARREGDQLLELIAATTDAALGRSGGLLTWGELLARCEQQLAALAEEGAALPLLVDEYSLAAVGVTATTPVAAPPAAAPHERAWRLLEEAQVVVVAGEAALLVTAAPDLARYGEEGAARDGGKIVVAAGRLQREIAASLHGPGRFVPVAAWQGGSPAARAPWSLAARPPRGALAPQGWLLLSIPLPAAADAAVFLYRPLIVESLGWAAVLLAAGVGWWAARRSAAAWTAAALAAAAAALLAPAALVAVGSGLFLGALLGGGVALASPRPSPPRPTEEASTITQVILRAALLLALGVGLPLAGPPALLAQPSAESPAAAPADPLPAALPTVYPVLIPVDDAGQPTGKYYLPKTLYDSLHRQAAATAPRGWLLRGAVYRAALDREPGGSRLALSQLRGFFELESFQRGAAVRLPLERDLVRLADGSLLLDGRAITADWTEDGRTMLLTLPEAGVYQLEVPLGPAVQSDGLTSHFALRVPPHPAARLEVFAPASAPAVEAPGALGALRRTGEGRTEAALGPAPQLSLRWPETEAGAPEPPRIEQLLWWQVGSDRVRLTARWKVRLAAAPVEQLVLAVDPRLTLVDPPSEVPAAPADAASGPRTITLDVPASTETEAVAAAVFEFSTESGIGQLPLPALGVRDAQLVRRWLALSVSDELEFEAAFPGAEVLPAAQFLQSWGAADAAPQRAFVLPAAGELAGLLTTRPRAAALAAAQQLDLVFDREGVAVRYQAEITAVRGNPLLYRIAAPAGFEVARVTLLENEAPVPIRFSAAEPGWITCLLLEVPQAPQTLQIEGRLPLPRRARVPLPQLWLVGASPATCEIRIERRPAVLVTLEAAEQLTPLAPPAASAVPGSRLVGLWKAESAEAAATVNIAPNAPIIEGRQVTRLRAEEGGWTASVDCRFHVEEGVLDAVRFEVPAGWGDRLTADPPAVLTLTPIAGENRRWLTVWPQQPLSGACRLELRGRIESPSGAALRTPDIRPLDLTPRQRLLVLPKRLQQRALTWETQGLRGATLPAELLAEDESEDDLLAFEVLGSRAGALLRPLRLTVMAPQVRLFDVRILWQRDNTYLGRAVWDLDPAGLSECELLMPPDARLIHVAVGGQPALLMHGEDDRTWRVPLMASRLPQRVETVFVGRAAAPAAQVVSLAAPALVGLNVEQSLWTVYGPQGLQDAAPLDAEAVIDPLRQGLFRLRALTAVMDLPAETLAESQPDELRAWGVRWNERWRRARAEVARRMLLPGAAADAQAGPQLADLDRRQAEVVSQLGESGPAGPAATDSWPIETLDASFAAHTPLCLMYQGGVKEVALRVAPARSSDLPLRLLAVGLMLAAAAAGSWAVRRARLLDSLLTWPQVIGVLAGLGWWLWLTPSLLGWGIVAVSLLPAWRSARVGMRDEAAPRIAR